MTLHAASELENVIILSEILTYMHKQMDSSDRNEGERPSVT